MMRRHMRIEWLVANYKVSKSSLLHVRVRPELNNLLTEQISEEEALFVLLISFALRFKRGSSHSLSHKQQHLSKCSGVSYMWIIRA